MRCSHAADKLAREITHLHSTQQSEQILAADITRDISSLSQVLGRPQR
jgi:hypothetical protein